MFESTIYLSVVYQCRQPSNLNLSKVGGVYEVMGYEDVEYPGWCPYSAQIHVTVEYRHQQDCP